MLREQAKLSHATLEALVVFMDHPSQETGNKVILCEKEADGGRTQLANALNVSFVTPMDREDIFSLSRAIDDMADYAKTTVEEMDLLEVPPNPHLREMAAALEGGTRLIMEAAGLLSSNGGGKNTAIRDCLIQVKKTENFVEKKYRQALRELFQSSDIIGILKAREIYRHLSNAADKMDEAANIMGDVMMKIA